MSRGLVSFKLIGALYSAAVLPVLYLRYQSREKRHENEIFIAAHGKVAPESERAKAVTHLLSGDATRVDSNEHFEGSRNCDLARKKAALMARGNVLEIGIGTGEKTLALHERNGAVKSVTGIDNHALSLRVCAKNVGDKKFSKPVTLVNARAENLPFPDKFFDTVLSEFSLCAVEDPVKAVQEMTRVAKGRVVILEHGLSYWRVIRKLGEWTSLFPDPQHPWSYGCYQDRDVLDIIKKSGATVKKITISSIGHIYLITLAPAPLTEPTHEQRIVPYNLDVVFSSLSSS